MCYRVLELFSACHCVYYLHAVDRCPLYGTPGHYVQGRVISVGYACPRHSAGSRRWSPRQKHLSLCLIALDEPVERWTEE
ncbi:hypothetical protein G6O67_001092 [Ophiocordyceps sinensis]|uniref:Uncharacterized protein n=1 Tax=Ophiocordyceps sinensis TaxID=72228 RepID=A0A8H4PWX2_9HYPO|nr:hypothetical protein G6O67_001092 [Ophiocordyceps sinensis]